MFTLLLIQIVFGDTCLFGILDYKYTMIFYYQDSTRNKMDKGK